MTHADIIAAKGTSVIAERLGVPAAHVRVWKSRRIPKSVYADLMEAFPEITLEALKAGEPGTVNHPHLPNEAVTLPEPGADGAENRGQNISRTGGDA